MTIYAYRCIEHGLFDSTLRADITPHPGCGQMGRRVWALRVDAESARHQGRWDPQVGAYVESKRQFDSLLSEGKDRVSEELNMEVKLALVDPRDQEGLAELHGQRLDERLAQTEADKRTRRDRLRR